MTSLNNTHSSLYSCYVIDQTFSNVKSGPQAGQSVTRTTSMNGHELTRVWTNTDLWKTYRQMSF